MTIIEQIKAEIEKLIERYGSVKAKGVLQEGYKGGRLIGYEDVLNILKRIQEESEKPINQDELEKEIETQVYGHFFDLNGIAIAGATAYATVDDMAYIARHFAKWGAEYLASIGKTSPKDLEEAANNYLDGVYGKMPHSDYHIAIFEAGAKWQKEQMMKEAVEGEVSHYATVHYVKTNESQLSARLKQFQDGDKVRIIIVKED